MNASRFPRLALTALAALSGLTLPVAASATDLALGAGTLTQGDFKALAEDLGGAASFKGLVPAETMGVLGFDVAATVSAVKLDRVDLWKQAGATDAKATLPTVGLRAVKGLPFDIDLGASLVTVPSTGVQALGAELRWAAMPGNVALPALALRLAGTRLSGIENLKTDTLSADVSISKGFLMATPYAGIGTVRVRATPAASTGLTRETVDLKRVFAGVNLNLGLINLGLEADRTGATTSTGLKIGYRF